jgi:hypothetical protein
MEVARSLVLFLKFPKDGKSALVYRRSQLNVGLRSRKVGLLAERLLRRSLPAERIRHGLADRELCTQSISDLVRGFRQLRDEWQRLIPH